MFQHNEFHAWSAANHAKVITGTQITGGSCVKMNVSADLLRRLPTESMTRLCHVVADVKLKNKKKKKKRGKEKKRGERNERISVEISNEYFLAWNSAACSRRISIFPQCSKRIYIVDFAGELFCSRCELLSTDKYL